MRARVVLGVLVVANAAFPAVAHAGSRADFKMAFTSRDPGASAGLDVRLLYKRPGRPKAKPVPVRQERFTFPAGTKFDSAVVPPCTASDVELMLRGSSACPSSWIGAGYGDTIMTGFPGQGETPLDVEVLLNGAEVKVVSRPKGFPFWFVTHGRTRGRVTTITIQRSPGGPPDGESALRRVHNVFPPRSRDGDVYTRTPPTCPRSRVWTFRARFTFADGVVEHDVYRMRCRRPRPIWALTSTPSRG